MENEKDGVKKQVLSAENNSKEISEKEARIRKITKLYYSNPKVQEAILEFAQNREVVPRYFEGFGKRPDMLQYPSDITGLVGRGATSFHCSEEIWEDPLKISSDMTKEEFDDIRKSWDLLIDIDSKYLDYSKIAARLIIEVLEENGIKNYGIKFSGSKGFHIIVSGKAFPKILEGVEMKKMFPEWPRAICGFLIEKIKPKYNKIVGSKINFESLELRTNLKKEDVTHVSCPNCGKESQKGKRIYFICPDCKSKFDKLNPRISKRGIRCISPGCMNLMEIEKEEECYYCESCKISNIYEAKNESNKNVKYTSFGRESMSNKGVEFEQSISEDILGGLDLVLVAPRHLFRMPYSLHEKTALASIVIDKKDIEDFLPGSANPLKIQIRKFMPDNSENEALGLLKKALEWKKQKDLENEKKEAERYANYKIDQSGNGKKFEGEKYPEIRSEDVNEDMFPKPIKKLLKGIQDGKKRGLFILLTFLKSLNYPPDYINNTIREWNKRNEPPLKESYLKGQIDWHIRQTKKILPPNYDNASFYKDLGLLDEKPEVKNPIVEVARKVRNNENKTR